MYVRKTKDVFAVQGNYGQGWETVTTEDTRKDARVQLQCYRENETQYSHRVVKQREKLA